jgi:hypothetical protein
MATDATSGAPRELLLTIKREGLSAPTLEPARFDVDMATFGLDPANLAAGKYRLSVPSGWSRRLRGPLSWAVVPSRLDPDRRHAVLLEHEAADGSATRSWTIPIRVALDLRTTFDPVLHGVPFPNRAADIGDVTPTNDLMRRTYLLVPPVLRRALFDGLYRNIVFLRADGPFRGGLCTGMARWSIACSYGEVSQPPSIEELALYHGRQLNDVALLASAPWFVRGSPRAAYYAVRRDALEDGLTRRALDIGVPKLWRKDVFSAVVREGHTVVPFRVRQVSPELAFVDVYDPNRSAQNGQPDVQTIEFKLAENRYQYRHLASFDDRRIGMVAASQAAYARRGTAFLAGLASLAMRLAGSFSTRTQ